MRPKIGMQAARRVT
jgi:hypothetical protein